MSVKKNEVEVKKDNALNAGFGLEAFASLKTKDAPILGLEAMNAEDIKMPRIKLAQPTSAEVGDEKCKQGQFYNVVTEEAYDALECQLLILNKSRVLWPDSFKRGDKPLCRSVDGIVADNGDICADCEHSQWNNNAAPPCAQSYGWLGLTENQDPFRISFARTGITEIKNFLTELTKYGLPPFVFKLVISSEKTNNDKGTYYVPKFSLQKLENGNLKTIDPKDAQSFQDLTEGLRSMFLSARGRDLDVRDDGDSEGGLF